jgi:acyl-CoA thioesterase FadM
MVTARLEVKYRLPTPLDQSLTLVGQRLKARGRLVTAHAELRLPGGAVTAEAEIALADAPEGVLPAGHLETLGWKVYD